MFDFRVVSYIISNMNKLQVVIDTNVFISALRSQQGASYRLLMLIDRANFEVNLSVPLILEYEDVAMRLTQNELKLTTTAIDDILDYLCAVANQWKIHYLWRPILKDPKDDMVLELAVSANCDAIVTYNKKDFCEADKFGIKIKTPKEILKEVGESK